MKVREIMNKPKVVESSATVKEAASIMAKNKIGFLIVVEGKKLLGLISERDILSKVSAKDKLPSKVKVKDVMVYDLVTIGPNDPLDDAAHLMTKNHIKKMPVLDSGELVGVITSTDVINNSDEIGQHFIFE